MDKKPNDDVPDLLRSRILRQRKRLKIVRFTFAVTAALSVLLLFGANQTQSLAPSSRTIHVIEHGDTTWLLDQHLEVTGQQGVRGGSFGVLRVRGDEVATGTRYDGVAVGAARVDDARIGITTPGRYMEMDVSGKDWERKTLEPLGLNDSLASPVIFAHGGELWLCWVGDEAVMIRPFREPGVAPKAVLGIDSNRAGLHAVVADDAVWLSVREDKSGDLKLISFTPGIEDAPAANPDDDADKAEDPAEAPGSGGEPRARQTHIKVHRSWDVTGNVRKSSFAVLEGRPIVALLRKEGSSRQWEFLVWTPEDEGSWTDSSAPPREKGLSGLELSNFMALASDGDALIAIYNDGGDVMSASAALGDSGKLEWSEPAIVPVDGDTGATAYIIWVSVLFGFLVLMAGQGVWLLMNRERTMDRTLAEILEKQEAEDGKGKKKELPKLMYANGLARGLALLLDIAMTSPLIILLQSIYSYSWEQAYGFLAIGSVSSMDVDLMPVIEGTLVTLMVLSVYGMVCEYFWGKTFGKAMFRLRVVDAEGEQPGAWRIVVRNFVKIFELIHWIVLLVPMALMMMTGKQQRLGDLLGGTYVIVEVVPEESPDDIDV